MRFSEYGKKGGTSKNAGKTASTYEATLPDGKTARMRSFQISSDTAYMGCYEFEGTWKAVAITAEIEHHGNRDCPIYRGRACLDQVAVEARKVG